MKLRHTLLVAALAILLTACNFTLAADVTPPPNYVPPTPMPTLGPLYPAAPPDVKNGGRIYIEKCSPCHGLMGLGDGEQGKQLPVKVAPLGLPDFARKAVPAAWYKQVTQGNLERFMPPFASLNDQERWDVASYALTLHMTSAQVAKGKSLLEANCADCAKNFSDPEKMSSLSQDNLVNIIKNGEGDVPAFGKDFTEEEAIAVAAYLRTLTFAAPPAESTATPVPAATSTPASTPVTDGTPSPDSGTPSAELTPTTESGTPSAQETPAEGTPIADITPESTGTASVATGVVSGKVENKTGEDFPSDGIVTLFGYEHGGDPSAGPAEVVKLEGDLNPDGTYLFENVEIPEERIFLVEVKVNDTTYQSQFAVVQPGMTELTLPLVTMYASTDDFSALKATSLQIFFDFATQGEVKVFAVYSIMNAGDKTVTVNMGESQDIPFIAFAEGANRLGYEATQDSAPFVPIENGFSMPPSEKPYGLVASASLQKAAEIVISQSLLLPVEKVSVFLPEGMQADGKTLTDEGVQSIQQTTLHIYSVSNLEKGAKIEFTVTGEPKDGTAVKPDVTQNQNLLIGVGAFGVVLILFGVWLFMRDRNKSEEDEIEEDEDEEDEFEDSESIMDAIIALDDLHRAGKISDEAYQKRREDLKSALKRKS